MKSVTKKELKDFLHKALTNESTRSVSDPPIFLDLIRKEELEPPVPYCLCHKIDLKPSMLETKHCAEKGCSYFSFLKQIWRF